MGVKGLVLNSSKLKMPEAIGVPVMTKELTGTSATLFCQFLLL